MYELLIIFDPNIDEQVALQSIREILKEFDTEVTSEEMWGLRTLAYPIKHKKQGRYWVGVIEPAQTNSLPEIKNELNIKEYILRYSMIKSRG